MKTKIIRIAVIVMGIGWLAFMIWPMPLGKVLNSNEDISISCLQRVSEDGKAINESVDYIFIAGTPQHDALFEILSRYTYHHTIRSAEKNISAVGIVTNVQLFDVNSGNLISTLGGRELTINSQVHTIDYFGDSNNRQLVNDIKNLIQKEAPDS